VAALACWAAAVAAGARSGELLVPFALFVDLVGGGLLLLALVRSWGAGVGWALVLSVLAYLLAALTASREVDPAAPVVGVFLFLAAELAYWSVELRPPARQARELPLRRLITVVAVALAAEVLAGLALLSAVPGRGRDAGVVLDAAGAAAAVAAVALLMGLPARRAGGGQRRW
jgi:hypothetical protein